ncbi:ATP11 family protein [Theileria parva strain Muguga]|uniref:ATP11 family protein n=1 Tax=Theileria parva strain Muguga TaxID=333668 RepID=UPI001C622AE3|nr:ATP11 family protein [Theileria parva strain Muguga]KAF5153702.1 ATP11 family protein [Theileria parva strain Muguga]
MGISYPCGRRLCDVVKLPLLRKLSPKRISQLWQQYYESTPYINAKIITSSDYVKIRANSRCKEFVIPVPKGPGNYFNLFLQFHGKSVLYTSVHSVNTRGITNSVPLMVLTFYDELEESHGIILLRSDVLGEITKEESMSVLENTLKFYIDFNLFQWVNTFNSKPKEFNYEDYIKQNNHIFNIF